MFVITHLFALTYISTFDGIAILSESGLFTVLVNHTNYSQKLRNVLYYNYVQDISENFGTNFWY